MPPTAQSIADRVRIELGDIPSTFDIVVHGNGVATRFETGHYPLDGLALQISIDGVPTADAEVEERTGVVTFDVAPADGAVVRFRGTKYRYFGGADILAFVETAIAEQFHRRTDDRGRQITLDNMPLVEEYPLAVLATTKALWALLTDASFDIDIHAPDGVSIPRSQRHRQLMDMLASRQQQYREYAAALNIGIDRIEVFKLRRVSHATGRLVPVWVEREIDNNSSPQRAYLPTNTYGADPLPSNKMQYDITLIRGDALEFEFDLGFDVTGYSYLAQIKQYANSQTRLFPLEIEQIAPTILRFSMSPKITANMPVQSVWDLQLTSLTDPEDIKTPVGGRVYCEQDVTR